MARRAQRAVHGFPVALRTIYAGSTAVGGIVLPLYGWAQIASLAGAEKIQILIGMGISNQSTATAPRKPVLGSKWPIPSDDWSDSLAVIFLRGIQMYYCGWSWSISASVAGDGPCTGETVRPPFGVAQTRFWR